MLKARPLLCALLFLMLALPPSSPAYTVQSGELEARGDVVMSPVRLDLELDPGESRTEEVSFTNRSGRSVFVEFGTQDFEGSEDPSQALVFRSAGQGARGAGNWVQPELDEIELAHGETLTMNIQIEVPERMRPGGYYAAVFGSVSGDDPESQSSGATTLLVITVSGSAASEGALLTPEIASPSAGGRIPIGIIFTNSGDVHLRPSGRIVVKNILGQQVADIPVPEWVVLPDAQRRTVVDWQAGGLSLGPYTVTAEISYGDGATANSSRTVWVFSLGFVLATLILLVIVIALLWYNRSRRRLSPAGPLGTPGAGIVAPLADAEGQPAVPAPAGAGAIEVPAVEAPAIPLQEATAILSLEEPAASLPDEEATAVLSPGEATVVLSPEEAAAAWESPVMTPGPDLTAAGPTETGGPKEAAGPTASPASDRIALSELFPSMEDERPIDLKDPETRNLVAELVNAQLELAQMYSISGEAGLAQSELREARGAAMRAGLFGLVAHIDDLLQTL